MGITERASLSIGKSTKNSELEAVQEAVDEAMQGCSSPKFGLVFATGSYDPKILAAELNKRLGSLQWAGCTSDGVFAGNQLMSQGVVLGLFSSDDLKVGVGLAKIDKKNSRNAGFQAVTNALKPFKGSDDRPKTIIILSDAKSGNIPEVIRGAVQEAGTMNVWAGGGIASIQPDISLVEFAGGQPFVGHVVAIVLDSSITTGTGISHGWQPYGPPTMVTRSKGEVTEELEYQKAFDVYQMTAANRGDTVTPEDFSRFSITHPLGIPQADGEYVIRDPLGVEPGGGLRFIAEVPDGCLVRVMEGNQKALLQAAWSAASAARVLHRENLSGAIIFDCVSRYMMLGSEYKQELDTFQKGLGEAVPFLGCLTMGEVGAFRKGAPQFHNKTAVVTGIAS